MDASRFKRRTTQTLRQPTNIHAEGIQGVVNPQPVSRRPATLPMSRPLPPTPAAPIRPPVAIAVTPTEAAKPPQPLAPVRPQLDMSLLDVVEQPKGWRHRRRSSGWFAVRKWAIRGTVAGLVLIIGAGGLLFSQGAFKLHKVFQGTATTAAALDSHVNPDLLKGEGDGRINVLLLGRGGGKHDAPDLTDTMILASIDPVNNTESLLSIPRDLWVKVPNDGSMKINAAWETGEFKYLGKIAPGSTDPKAIQAGFDLVDQSVESVLGVQIHYNLILNFDAFQQAVTTVGGVSVNVPSDLVDPTMAWQNGNSPVLAKAGLQNFNGAQALNYVRSRETTSDFARSQRQRAVILALKQKLKSLGTVSNPVKLSQLINDFGNNVSSDLSLNNANRLYSITSVIGDDATSSIGLADKPNNFIKTGAINGQSVDIPSAGLNNYTAIQQYIRTQLKDGHILKENAPVMIYNGTTLPGVATATANTLKTYGYNVIGAANTPNTGWTQTIVVDFSGGSNNYTRNYLEQRFKVKATNQLPDNTIVPNGAKFVIIVGSDEATTTQN